MKILFNRETKRYLPIIIDDTSDMDKVIDKLHEWMRDSEGSANEKLLELDIVLELGEYWISEISEGVLEFTHLDDDPRGGFCYSYDFELRDLSTIKIK